MNSLIYLLWALMGMGLAVLMIKTQQWSVKMMTTEKPKQSMLIIIGGAILRWGMFFVIHAFALSHSILALLILFVAFMISRIILIVTWHRMLAIRQEIFIH